jgi:predicted MFS family arabinose efflux permease
LLADAFGWRAIYVIAAVLTAFLAVLLARAVPMLPPRPPVRYRRLLGSVFAVVRQHRAAQGILMIGSAAFAVFTMFWTGLTFLLSSAPFSYSATQIGLVGLAGLAGTFAAKSAGQLHDRGLGAPATGTALLLALVSLAIAGVGSTSIIVVLVGTVLLQAAIQAVNVLNQISLFALDPDARSRLNTAFVTGNFIGGAIGSALAGVLWQFGGWLAITVVGAALIALAFIAWLSHRK